MHRNSRLKNYVLVQYYLCEKFGQFAHQYQTKLCTSAKDMDIKFQNVEDDKNIDFLPIVRTSQVLMIIDEHQILLMVIISQHQ